MEEFKPKKVEGRVKMLRVLPYKGCPVYIRMIGDDYFEYMVIFKNEIYSSYIIITPEKGKNKLTETQIGYYADLIRATAEATVDALLGTKVDDETKKIVDILERSGVKVKKKKLTRQQEGYKQFLDKKGSKNAPSIS